MIYSYNEIQSINHKGTSATGDAIKYLPDLRDAEDIDRCLIGSKIKQILQILHPKYEWCHNEWLLLTSKLGLKEWNSKKGPWASGGDIDPVKK